MNLEELQKNWNKFGISDPLWGILAWPDKSENRWQIDDFFATGVREIDDVFDYVAGLALTVRPGTALDFGCGVGRLCQALARHFDAVHGVDISPAMLALAEHYNHAGERCQYHLNERADLTLFDDRSFDFIYSNITLQHMQPRYSKAYMAEFVRVLAPGGVLIFQAPDRAKRWQHRLLQPIKPTSIFRTYQKVRYGDKPVMEMYGVPRSEVERLLADHGGRVVDVRPDTSADALWYSYRYCVTKTA